MDNTMYPFPFFVQQQPMAVAPPNNDIVMPTSVFADGVKPVDTSSVVVSDKTDPSITIEQPEEAPKKRGRPRKVVDPNSTPVVIVPGGIALTDDNATNKDGTVNYQKTYAETSRMLKSAIGQTDMLLNDVANDIQEIRGKTAMANKHRTVAELTEVMGELISTKITAIKELNNSITHINDMTMKQQKDLRQMNADQNDDKKIMDMYNAYMSIPMGQYGKAPAISIQDITSGINSGVNRVDIMPAAAGGGLPSMDPGYQNFLTNMTPEQNAMRYEDNPNVKTVVVYDQSNGRKWFDVIDTSTGASIPNVPRPDDFLLDDTRPDLSNMVARNANINVTYPLVVVGQANALSSY